MNKKEKSSLKSVWKVVSRLLSIHKERVTFLALLGVVLSLVQGVTPYIAGKFFDSLVAPSMVTLFDREWQLWVVVLTSLAIIHTLDTILNWKLRTESQALGMRIFTEYTTDAFTNILRLPVSFHKEEKMGKIGNKVSRAANALNNTFVPLFTETASEMLSIVVALTVLSFINGLLTVVLAASLVVYVVIVIQKIPEGVAIQKKSHKVWTTVWGDVWESLMNGITVKHAAAESYEHKRIEKGFQKRAYRASLSRIRYWAIISVSLGSVMTITRMVIFALSAQLVISGIITIGELVAFNAYTGFVFNPLRQLSFKWQSIQSGAVEIHEMEKIITKTPENYSPDNVVHLGEVKGAVSFEDVSFWYKKKQPVLGGVSFEAKPDQTIALVGESGVGKSTVADLLVGFYFPKKGKVSIDGVDIRKINLEELRSQISVVPQDVVLFNDTIENNIKYGTQGKTHEDVLRVAEKAHARDFIEKLPKGWKTKVGERGVKLSGGQKQRIGIARALLQDPRILILDEPTSALDPQTERDIQDSLEVLMQNTTTFIIAHRFSTVRSADQILVFKDGVIVEQGTHEELLEQSGEYERLYSLQTLDDHSDRFVDKKVS